MVYGTVAEALEKAGITLGPDDYTVPAQDSLVGIGSTIQVHRVRYEETVEYQTIPHDTEYVYTSLYFRDTDRTTTLQTGQDGQCAITTPPPLGGRRAGEQHRHRRDHHRGAPGCPHQGLWRGGACLPP